jgi:hypothetical protein
MDKKLVCVGILFCLIVSALAASVAEHNIRIVLKEEDKAQVVEEYWLMLPTEQDKNAFNQAMGKEGFTLEDWAGFQVKKTIVLETEKENIIPEKTSSNIGLVKVEYDVPEITETLESITGRKETYGITENAFSFYDPGTQTISFPQSPETELTILILEEVGEIKELTPEPYTRGIEVIDGKQYNRYTWDYKHPFTASKFRVVFEREVAIQSRLSLENILEEIREKYVHPIYIPVIIILMAMMYWYRKELGMLLGEAFTGEAVIHEEETTETKE